MNEPEELERYESEELALRPWRVERCDIFEDMARREFIARVELCLPTRTFEDRAAFKAWLTDSPLTVVPSKALDELLRDTRKMLRERNDRIRELEGELGRVADALRVLRELEVGE